MNEIYELKKEIQEVYVGEKFSTNKNQNNIIENLELQFSPLKQENNFLKIEINLKQKAIDKLLDLNWVQSKCQLKVNDNNKTGKKYVEKPPFQDTNPSRNVYSDNKKQSHTSGKPKTIKLKTNLMLIVSPK